MQHWIVVIVITAACAVPSLADSYGKTRVCSRYVASPAGRTYFSNTNQRAAEAMFRLNGSSDMQKKRSAYSRPKIIYGASDEIRTRKSLVSKTSRCTVFHEPPRHCLWWKMMESNHYLFLSSLVFKTSLCPACHLPRGL